MLFMKMKLGLLSLSLFFSQACFAAFLIEIDTDGADDGNLAFSSNFSFGGDTTSASQSSASTAVGLTNGDSLFGGNGAAQPDTYAFVYSPASDIDNLTLAAGTALNSAGAISTGVVGGNAGTYNVYATWPITSNVSGGLTSFELPHDGGLLSLQIDQNGQGDEWVLLGSADFSPGSTYTLTQTPETNSFVSMRSAGVMFERIPEPSSIVLLLAAVLGFSVRRSRPCA